MGNFFSGSKEPKPGPLQPSPKKFVGISSAGDGRITGKTIEGAMDACTLQNQVFVQCERWSFPMAPLVGETLRHDFVILRSLKYTYFIEYSEEGIYIEELNDYKNDADTADSEKYPPVQASRKNRELTLRKRSGGFVYAQEVLTYIWKHRDKTYNAAVWNCQYFASGVEALFNVDDMSLFNDDDKYMLSSISMDLTFEGPERKEHDYLHNKNVLKKVQKFVADATGFHSSLVTVAKKSRSVFEAKINIFTVKRRELGYQANLDFVNVKELQAHVLGGEKKAKKKGDKYKESIGVLLQTVSEPKKQMGDEGWNSFNQPGKRESWEMSVRANQQLGSAYFTPEKASPEPFIPGLLNMSFDKQKKAISDYYKNRPNPPLYDDFLAFCKNGELDYINRKNHEKLDKKLMAHVEASPSFRQARENLNYVTSRKFNRDMDRIVRSQVAPTLSFRYPF